MVLSVFRNLNLIHTIMIMIIIIIDIKTSSIKTNNIYFIRIWEICLQNVSAEMDNHHLIDVLK
jgi:hypothetical protein